jgi:chromosome segregation ATPase
LTIRFSSDAALAALARMRNSEQELGACQHRAGDVRIALSDADPRGTNKVLELLTADFEAVMEQLRTAEREMQELIAGTEAMQQRFEDAEEQNSRRVDRIGTDVRADAGFTGATRWQGQATVPGVEWALPRAVVLPDMRGSAETLVPDWLQGQLDDSAQFLEWT